MAIWVDPRTGELQEADDETALEYGLRPASDEDIDAHNQRLGDASVDTKGTGGLIVEGLQRGIGHYVDAPNAIATGLIGDAGADAGLVEETDRTTGADLFPEAFSDAARRRSELHPFATGFGTGLAALPLAVGGGVAGAGAAGAAGLGGLGVAGGAVLGEAAVEAVTQEYDDAWLEQRPMQLKNVAGYTAMFALGDVLLRGVGRGVRAATRAADVGGTARRTVERAGGALGLGSRNMVAEAQSKAAARGARPAQSVGAASASEMADDFDDAIGQMKPRDAIVMARDADDHYHLVARDVADEVTRIYDGLSESLGNQLKRQDVQIYMDGLNKHTLERQAKWVSDIADQAYEVADELERGGVHGVNTGDTGKVIASELRQYADQLRRRTDPAERFELVDGLKRRMQKRVTRLADNHQMDPIVRDEILDTLDELVGVKEVGSGRLLNGLQDPKLWGRAAKLQKALNKPWHDMLKSWGTFQQAFLKATGEKRWGETGAGRIVKEASAEQILGILQKDPRLLMDLGKHVARVFEGYQGLIDARQAHGLVGREGLAPLENSLRNLMEDWNLAATISTAVNKSKNKLRDPRNWAGLGLDAAERLPGVGGVVGAVRSVGRNIGDLHIQRGTALANVWDNALRRYAQHPSLGDTAIHAQYSPWMQDALRMRGAPIPAPPGGSAVADAASRVAGAGLVAAGANQAQQPQDPNAPAQAGAGPAGIVAAGLAMMLGKNGRRLLKEEAAPLIGVLARQEGKDDWTHARVRNWLKGSSPLSVAQIETHTAQPTLYWDKATGLTTDLNAGAQNGELRAFVSDAMARTGATEDQVVREVLSAGSGFRPRAPRDPNAPVKPRKPKPAPEAAPEVADRTGIEGDFDDMADEMRAPPDVKDALSTMRAEVSREERAAMKAYQSAAGYKMNQALRTGDYSSMASERAGDVEAALSSAIDSGATAPGFVLRGIELSPEDVQALTRAKVLTAQAFMSTSPNPQLAKRFANAGKMKRVQGHGWRKPTGDVPVLFEVEQATGVPLSAGEILLRPGTQFKVLAHRIEQRGTKAEPRIVHVFRVRESGYRPGAPSDGIIAGGLLGLAGAGAALASPSTASAAEPPAPDDYGPAGRYRDAIRSIDEGGDAIIRDHASAALRRTPPKGRSALRAFTGRKSLDAAVDEAREAIEELGQNPEALLDTLGGSVGDLSKTHPAVYSALVQKASSIVAYLAPQVPPRVGQTLLDPEGLPPSTDRSLDFAYKVVGSLMPDQAMADISRLDVPPEELEAFQHNWPELWEPLRAEMLGQTQRRHEAGRPVDSEKLRQLDAILGMNGLLDPSGSLDVAQNILDAASAAPPQPPEQAPSTSSHFRTRAQSAAMEAQSG